jgi:hypothetical protein
MHRKPIQIAIFALLTTILCSSTPTLAQTDAQWTQNAKLWRDPGAVENLDMATGPDGLQPQQPFTFLEEVGSGTSSKMKVRDATDRLWAVKFGSEAKAEAFNNRFVWALGYFSVPTYFIVEGWIQGLKDLDHGSDDLREDGHFRNARFQLWDEKRVQGRNWTWKSNPFVGTREFNGLKVLVMLVSNWDNKDARNVDSGSNNAISEHRTADGKVEYRYFVSDWGGSLGKLGFPGIRNKWDCRSFTQQSRSFVRGVKDGEVKWGYTGTHSEVKEGITLEDVRWLLKYLGRLSDQQLLAALKASGADPEEQVCFLAALRDRIQQLRQIANGTFSNGAP